MDILQAHNPERATDLLQRYANLSSDRGMWETHWEEIARKVLPGYSQNFLNNSLNSMITSQGQKKTEEMVDCTAANALIRFASAMESMLTPRSSKWQYIIAEDKTLNRNRSVKLWFERATEALFHYRYAPSANFASQKHEDYMALGAFGTGCIFTDSLVQSPYREKGLRYRAIHLGEIFFAENHQGIIDTAYRKFDLTARNAIAKFGAENLPESIVDAAKKAQTIDKKFWFIHCVTPRTEAEGFRYGNKDLYGMPFRSEYVSVEGKQMASQESGFHTFPYSISRYVIAPGELYGRSPAMMALPSINVLNEEKKTVLKQGHRTVDPVLLAFDDGVIDTFSLRPGSINAGGVTADGKPLIHALPTGNLSLAKEMMDEERKTINDIFLVTLFQILVETPQMTATEVLERAREKGALLSPTMGRQQSESLGPMTNRELDVLASQGLLEPMPQMLIDAGGTYGVRYDSPLSRMAKAEEASGLFRTIDWIREFVAVTQDPSPLDWIKWDEAMPALLDIQAVPTLWQSSPEEVAAIRQGRAQAKQNQQAIQAAPAAASMMRGMKYVGTSDQGAPK